MRVSRRAHQEWVERMHTGLAGRDRAHAKALAAGSPTMTEGCEELLAEYAAAAASTASEESDVADMVAEFAETHFAKPDAVTAGRIAMQAWRARPQKRKRPKAEAVVAKVAA